MANYYDYVLGTIPLAMAIPVISLAIMGIPLTQATPLGAVAAISLIGHAMFVRTPTDQPASTIRTDAPHPQTHSTTPQRVS